MKRFLPLFILLLVGGRVATAGMSAPSDAVVLFAGENLDAWTNDQGGPANATIDHDLFTVEFGAGSLTTRQSFADCQLHVEWRAPGGSSVWLQGRYEVPLPARGVSGHWQTCDITFHAPRFNNDGSVKTPATVDVFSDGIIVPDHVEFKGTTNKSGYEKHAFKQPLILRAQSGSVSFRNLWIRELGVRQLLNGHDATGWYSFLEKLGKNNDPEGNFKIIDGLLHIEGKNFGYLATEEVFANYYLRVVFKWGQHQYAPRATGKRDSGVLYHFAAGEPDKVWPKSIECQVQEGDCGDIWCVGTPVESPNASEQAWGMKHIFRSKDFEHPLGEWNTIEIICNGAQLEHYVNGHLVNSGTSTAVSSGKILLQSEGAEVYYQTVELIPY